MTTHPPRGTTVACAPIPIDSDSSLLRLYRNMLVIRQFEDRLRNFYVSGAIAGLLHLSAGQEAVAVGVCSELEADDWIASNHRGHAHCIAKGARIEDLLAEIFGKASGICGGRSGSMHIFDRENGNLGTNGIVGGGIPLATGAALSAKTKGARHVAACFFGDGALNQGIFHECLNMASIWVLPVIYVCENNGYGEYTPLEAVTAGASLVARGEVFGIPSQVVDGMDLLAVKAAMRGAVARARAGNGPTFLVCNTYRYGGHHVADKQEYKDKQEIAEWQSRDPILRFSRHLIDHDHADARQLDLVKDEVNAQLAEAVEATKRSVAPTEDDLTRYLYA